MRKFQNLPLYGCFILFFSCQSPMKKSGDFKLLPLPQQFEIEGSSSLKYDGVQDYFTFQNNDLPIRGDLLKNIQPVEGQSKAQIIYSIDNSLDLQAEGYTLNISKKQITITGKDKAGLFYAFKTLEQFMEDAKEQDVYLPLCSIKDFPSLAFRSIHLDIKHHIDKTDYYYQLIDKTGQLQSKCDHSGVGG